MISIVAHGIMGTSYRQDIVVDEGVTENGSILVLNDIRRQLSSLYGDDTPMTGWALQPASCGIWMSRIERAFDSNYIPAYVMVSFLIPLGKHLPSTATQIIEHSLVVNHSKFMQQSVVLHKPDWGFLHVLGRELEGMLDDATGVNPYEWKEGSGAACFSGDISSMLASLWDSRFLQYKIIYCGTRILSADKEFPLLDVVAEPDENSDISGDSTIPSQDSSEMSQPNSESEYDNTEDVSITENKIEETAEEESATVAMGIGEDADDIGEPMSQKADTDNAGSSIKQEHPDGNHGLLYIFTWIVLGALLTFNIAVVAYWMTTPPDLTSPVDTNYEVSIDSVYDDDIDSFFYEFNDSVEIEEVVVKESSSEVSIRSKINISSPSHLFLCLTWDNVKDNGKLFYEKYEVPDPKLKHRIDIIIKEANKNDKGYYIGVYHMVSILPNEEKDRLYYLESFLFL